MKNHQTCPVCEGSNFKSVAKPFYFRGEREEFNVDACMSCGFWLTNPAPEGEALAAYYDTEDYVSHTDGKGSLMDKVYGVVRDRAIKSKFGLINNLAGVERNLVDYGAGTGEFLAYAKSQAWEARGFEPSQTARENAQRKSLDLYDPEDRDNLEMESVGVFTLWHVLEHIPDLNETLKYFHTRLMSKGYLVLALPNHESGDAKHYGNNWAAFDVPLHLWHFSKSDIEALARKHGFLLNEIHNMPFDSFYVSLLSEKNATGRMRPLSAFWQGLRSNISGRKPKNMSSLIYVLRKTA